MGQTFFTNVRSPKAGSFSGTQLVSDPEHTSYVLPEKFNYLVS